MAGMQRSSFNPIGANGETPHVANICAFARANYDSSQNDLREFMTIRRAAIGPQRNGNDPARVKRR
jgi:hypothetical protein